MCMCLFCRCVSSLLVLCHARLESKGAHFHTTRMKWTYGTWNVMGNFPTHASWMNFVKMASVSWQYWNISTWRIYSLHYFSVWSDRFFPFLFSVAGPHIFLYFGSCCFLFHTFVAPSVLFCISFCLYVSYCVSVSLSELGRPGMSEVHPCMESQGCHLVSVSNHHFCFAVCHLALSVLLFFC